MLHAMKSEPNQFEFAKWAESDRLKTQQIRVSIVNENERRYVPIIRNLNIEEDNVTLRTNYLYPYKIGQEMYYRDQWYTIEFVSEITLDLNPNALRYSKTNINKQIILGLVIAANG